jgi:predicted  nucleic acid-binding Zn-ribbon protein
MLEGIQHLLELQRLDGEITRRQEILAGFPDKRRQHAASVAETTARLEAARVDLTTAEMGQRNAESVLQDQEALHLKLEGQQFQVKDNTAYTALLAEMEHAKSAISECETKILIEMEKIETSSNLVAASESTAAETQGQVDAGLRELDEREKKLSGELEALASDRALVGPRLEREILSAYERVAKSRHPALALASKETCEGCRVGIPAQNYIEVLKGERLIICENCRRILLHRDMVPTAES